MSEELEVKDRITVIQLSEFETLLLVTSRNLSQEMQRNK